MPGLEPVVHRRADRRVEDGEVHSSLRLPQAGVVTDCQWDAMKLLADLLVGCGQVGETLAELEEMRLEQEAGREALEVSDVVGAAFGQTGPAGPDLVDDCGC